MMKMNEIFSLKAHVCKKVTFLNSEIRYVRRHVGIFIHLEIEFLKRPILDYCDQLSYAML